MDDPFSNRKFLKRHDYASQKGWEFQYERDPIKESKFFNDKKYGSKESSFAAAVAHRDAFLKAASELGYYDPETPNSRYELPLLLALSARNTSGIVGVHRAHRDRKGRPNPEINWIANYKDDSGKNIQKKYPVTRLGEKQALLEAVTFRRNYEQRVVSVTTDIQYKARINEHIEELGLLLEYIAALTDDSDVFFFLGTINNPLLSHTYKQDMLNVRIGQQRFRKLVLDLWNHKCSVTGARVFITAAHIKPWSQSDNTERLDPFNGLPLSPVYDKAFA